jgi:hypothetical protein
MKLRLTLVAVAILAAGCSSTKTNVDPGTITAINNQSLTTTFTRQGVKLEWECKWGSGITDATCIKGNIKAIEVTGYAPSFGNSEALREQAFLAAETNAKSRLVRFMQEGLQTSVVINTITKNIEKAHDNIKQQIKGDTAMTDEEALNEPGANISSRINTNETIRTLTESIRTNAEGKLRGAYVKDAQIVDRQTVKVTIRWDQDSSRAVNQLRKHFR